MARNYFYSSVFLHRRRCFALKLLIRTNKLARRELWAALKGAHRSPKSLFMFVYVLASPTPQDEICNKWTSCRQTSERFGRGLFRRLDSDCIFVPWPAEKPASGRVTHSISRPIVMWIDDSKALLALLVRRIKIKRRLALAQAKLMSGNWEITRSLSCLTSVGARRMGKECQWQIISRRVGDEWEIMLQFQWAFASANEGRLSLEQTFLSVSPAHLINSDWKLEQESWAMLLMKRRGIRCKLTATVLVFPSQCSLHL